MVMEGKAIAASVSAVGLVTLMSGMVIHFNKAPGSNDIMNVMDNEAGAVAGRQVAVSAKLYRETFKANIELGQCPLVRKEDGDIQKCNAAFEGTKVLLAKAAMTADVVRVESSEDIMLHVMGGVGASVGVLGLVSVGVKVNVAVTTETTKKNLNLLSSYEINRGVVTLQSPRPKGVITETALFLSEIELGGHELLLVTLDFESEKQKVDVQITITFKILFISISAKIRFVHTTFKSKASVRIQLKSSFRTELDERYDNLDQALPRIEAVEKMYMEGPKKLIEMSDDDVKLHNFYYFSSWKQSPYGLNFNLALINHDLDFLNSQNTEMYAVIERIKILSKKTWSGDQRDQMNRLNQTLTEKTGKLTKGLDSYHSYTPAQRQGLRDIYGPDKAPLYYSRELNEIIGE